jgi:hypothetical protein
MQKETSNQLIDSLKNSDSQLRRLTQVFAEIAKDLPIRCFFETQKTEMLRRFLSSSWASSISAALSHKTQKIVCYPSRHVAVADLEQLVTEDSACLDTFRRRGLDATHSGMNKFDGPESKNFKLVKNAIRDFANDSSTVLSRRKNCKLTGSAWSRRYPAPPSGLKSF